MLFRIRRPKATTAGRPVPAADQGATGSVPAAAVAAGAAGASVASVGAGASVAASPIAPTPGAARPVAGTDSGADDPTDSARVSGDTEVGAVAAATAAAAAVAATNAAATPTGSTPLTAGTSPAAAASAATAASPVPISAAGSAGVPTSVTKPTLGVAPRSVATVAVVSIVGLLAVGLLASGLLFRGGAVVAPSGSPGSAPSDAIAGGGTAKGTIDIALELMPSKSPISVGIANGVKLALAEAGGAAGGWKVELPASAILDDGGDAEHGKANMQAIAGQPSVMAVIGPQQSGIASGQIPISNAAGLLQCSPSAASDSLTKPDAGR